MKVKTELETFNKTLRNRKVWLSFAWQKRSLFKNFYCRNVTTFPQTPVYLSIKFGTSVQNFITFGSKNKNKERN